MNRRSFVSLLAGAGATLAGARLYTASGLRDATPSFWCVSESPEEDARRLLRAIHAEYGAPFQLSTAPIGPAPQDITIVKDGSLLDPSRALDSGPLAALQFDLRERKRPAATLLCATPVEPRTGSVVRVEVDGVVVEELDAGRSYRYVDLKGARSDVTLRSDNGLVSVVRAGCRHETCRKMGPRRNGRILCVPNRLVVTLPGRPSVDAVTG